MMTGFFLNLTEAFSTDTSGQSEDKVPFNYNGLAWHHSRDRVSVSAVMPLVSGRALFTFGNLQDHYEVNHDAMLMPGSPVRS